MGKEKKYYTGLDGLRMVAALGIIAVHVAKNNGYTFESYFYTNVICKLESFVNVFILISGFAMCCGYYDKVKNGQISLNDFYAKRYQKVWPFFAVLVIIDVLYSWEGISTLADGFANLTLAFAFLPGASISVLGVGWTLGVIFAFYMLFPFFVFLLWTPKRAWLAFVIAIAYDFFRDYFFAKDSSYILCNILVWACYFLAGGLIFLYKEAIETRVQKGRHVCLLFGIVSLAAWFVLPDYVGGFYIFTLKTLLCSTIWIMYAISVKSPILSNRITSFVSKMSLEIYLLHMMVCRILQKIGLTTVFGKDNVFSYVTAFVLTFMGTIVVAIMIKYILEWLRVKMKSKLQNCRSVQ